MSLRSTRSVVVIVAMVALVLGAQGCSSLGVLAYAPASAADQAVQTSTQTAPEVNTTIAVEEAVSALESQIMEVYELAAPAVVNITNRGYVYDRFMGTVPQEGSGSGFVYDNEGHIVTNYHVVENAEELLVTLADDQTYEAQIVGSDATNDLAVIHIVDGAADLPDPLVLGDSADLQVGQFVLAIGNPFGLEQTLTTGVVSALGRVIQSPEDNRFIGEAIQTDAAINPGNSGGPLLDLWGQVIGVNSQIISSSGTSSGVGFAVSASTVHRVVPQLISNGEYAHPWLGVSLLSLTDANVKTLRDAGVDLPVDAGVLVLEAEGGSPADQAGLRGGSQVTRVGNYRVQIGGDIITAIDGRPLVDSQDLTVYLETETSVGDTVELAVVRDGERRMVQVVLGEQS